MFAARSLRHAATLLLAAGSVTACGSSGGFSADAALPRDEAHVVVTNQNWSDIKVYAMRGTLKYRIGTVTSFTSARLRLPPSVTSASDFRIRVELIGSSESYTSERFFIHGGDEMSLVVNSHLPLSQLAIR